MKNKLSNRLQTCLDALKPLQTIADIGTDHAYLPCAGLESKQLQMAVAIDIAPGPLKQAEATIKSYGFQAQIETRLGSGLKPLKPGEVEGVVIAGMGGRLISEILTESIDVAKSMKRLVLQPNMAANFVRQIINDMAFVIVDEHIVSEDGHIYEVVVAQPKDGKEKTANDSENDIKFGPILRLNPKCPAFVAKWEHELKKIEIVLEHLPPFNEKREKFEHEKQLIEDVLGYGVNS